LRIPRPAEPTDWGWWGNLAAPTNDGPQRLSLSASRLHNSVDTTDSHPQTNGQHNSRGHQRGANFLDHKREGDSGAEHAAGVADRQAYAETGRVVPSAAGCHSPAELPFFGANVCRAAGCVVNWADLRAGEEELRTLVFIESLCGE
jgi:hypothetical protein